MKNVSAAPDYQNLPKVHRLCQALLLVPALLCVLLHGCFPVGIERGVIGSESSGVACTYLATPDSLTLRLTPSGE